MSRTSGRSSGAIRSASSALGASPTTSMSGAVSAWRIAERTKPWSSTSITRRTGLTRRAASSVDDFDGDPRPVPVARPDVQRRADELGPFAHPAQAVASGWHRRRVEPAPIVGDRDARDRPVRSVADADDAWHRRGGRTLLSASWTMRRTSASVRGGRRWSVPSASNSARTPNRSAKSSTYERQHLLEARRGGRVVAHRHDRLARLGEGGVDRVEHLAGGRLRASASRLAFWVSRPCLSLAYHRSWARPSWISRASRGPLGQRGVRGIDVAQPPELGVGAAERPIVHAELGDDAHHQDRVEAQSQGIGRGHDPGRDDRVEREVELAERGDDEPRRQVRRRTRARRGRTAADTGSRRR